MSQHSIFGLAAQALLVAWIIWKITARAPLRQRRFFAATAAALALVPVADGVCAAMALRALWGDPSITTMQLLALTLAGRPAAIGRAPAAALGLSGLAFYPLALGLGDFDPYRLGYPGWPAITLVVLLAMAAFLAWQRGRPLYLWLLVTDLTLFATGLPESDNLLDALLDPLLIFAAALHATRCPALIARFSPGPINRL